MNMVAHPRRFALYFLSDSHGQNDGWPVGVLRHLGATFGPDAKALVVYGGDLFCVAPDEANDEAAIKAHYDALLANPALCALRKRAAFAHQWDDWDFLGDNSCETHTGDRGYAKIDRRIAIEARQQAFPAPGICSGLDRSSFGWYATFGKALVIAPDSRSMKSARAIQDDGACTPIMDGSGMPHVWGIEQWRGIADVLAWGSAEARHVFFLSTQTFVDNLIAPPPPCAGHAMGARDSLGLYHKYWRNELLAHVQALGIADRFTALSGDDHTALVRERDFWHAPYHLWDEQPECRAALNGLRIREYKAGNGGSTTRIFDSALQPPLWWGGPAGEYEHCRWGQDEARADCGYCFSWETGDPAGITVRAVLFEDEPDGRTAPHEFWCRRIDDE